MLTALTKETGAWRKSFAGPAIAAVDGGSQPRISGIARVAGIDQQAPETTISCLIAGIADGQGTLISLAPGITDRITVSIGIASAPNQAHDRVTPLRLADQALYRAKRAGKNRTERAELHGRV